MDIDNERPNDASPPNREMEALRARLEQSDRRIYEFVARLAHELRTPLGAILMWAHVLRMGREADRDAAVDAIDASARAQSKMIGILLDVSRALAGRLRIERLSVDLGGAVRLAIEELAPTAAAHDIKLDVSIDDGQFRVRGDVTRLAEMVSNLVANGIKFTPAGGTVQLRLTRAGNVARIVIRDTGCGLSPEEIPEIFTAFRSPSETDSRITGGLGLGLAFVRLLAELHAGTVRADSDGSGRGSTFTVEIPLEPAV